MAKNPKVDEALSLLVLTTSTYLDAEPQVADSFDLYRENLSQIYEEIVRVADAILVARDQENSGDLKTRVALRRESWRQLAQMAVSVNLAIGHFPYYDDLDELFPGATQVLPS